jgi:hypothetical protein
MELALIENGNLKKMTIADLRAPNIVAVPMLSNEFYFLLAA